MLAGGILVSPANLTSAAWYNGTYTLVGANQTSLDNRAGYANTTTIVGYQGPGTYAASLCMNYAVGWHLPTKDELNKIYINKNSIAGLSNGNYWSSSENTSYYAWCQDFSTGVQTSLPKNNIYFVRASRCFYTSSSFPVVSTTPITSRSSEAVVGGGNVESNEGSEILARGVCWNTTGAPTITDNKTTDGTGTGLFTSSMTGLVYGQTYYIRAYATNMTGTGYGAQRSFTYTYPLFITPVASSITQTSAIISNNITSDGGQNISARGICWNQTGNPSVSDNIIKDGNAGTGTFTSPMANLTGNTTYYVKTYAVGEATSYSTQISFTTAAPVVPTVTANSPSAITPTSALSGGNIISNGGCPITVSGICWGTSPNLTIDNAIGKTTNNTKSGSYSGSLTGLTGSTTYYVSAYATNCAGTGYSSQSSFTTLAPILPSITTSAVSTISSTSAASGGTIINNGGCPITARGVCVSMSQDPTITNCNFKSVDGTGSGTFKSSINSLYANLTIHVRAYATNCVGTAYGADVTYLSTYAIGESLTGGVVAYVYKSGDPGYDAKAIHGFITTVYDQIGLSWWNGSYINTGATGTALGTGKANTNSICNKQGAPLNGIEYAAHSNLSLNGLVWYLPSKEELNKLYLNRVAIGNFSSNTYWSSSESADTYNNNYENAYMQDFTTGTQNIVDKSSNRMVRPIIYF
jgi:hypothetical protein